MRGGNALALLLIVLAQAAFGAGSWIKYDSPVNYTGDVNAIVDCEVDSKGTLWFLVANTGLFSQSPDNQTYKSYTLPANMLGKRMGLYMNPANDSLWIGGRNGIVYAGKNGVFSAKPAIPLKYSNRFLAITDQYWDLTHVNDFIVDANGRFIASTDSLAWWFNGDHWDTLGNLADYPQYQRYFETDYPEDAGFGLMLGSGPILDANGVVWFSDGTRIKKDGTFMPLKSPYLPIGGAFAGTDGNIYSHDSRNLLLRYSLPNYTVDTIFLTQGTQGWTEYWTSGIWQDENGWIWVGQSQGVIKLVKDDQVKYAWDFGYGSYAFVHFKRSETGDFWACSNKYLFRYSEPYSIPAEATGAIAHANSGLSNMQFQTSANGLSIRTSSPLFLRIVSLQGQLAWQGRVEGEQNIALPQGIWYLQSSSERTIPVIVP